MSPSSTQTAHHVLTGVTIGGGAIEWITLNSSFITVVAVVVTSIASIMLGAWNAKSNSDRNKVNRRDIIATLLTDLEHDEDKSYSVSEIKAKLRGR